MIFVPGHTLSRALYEEIVAPLMVSHFPTVPWAAALIGEGSDVLGYDTERSMDHDWGPRLNILLLESDIHEYKPKILAALDTVLPSEIRGIPIDIPPSSDIPGDEAHYHHTAGDGRTHGVRIETAEEVLLGRLGVASVEQFDLVNWLTTPQQTLLELTSGPQFRDDIGVLTDVRTRLAWYPDDLWRYRMASQWKRIAQLEAFVGRCGEVGDDLGSQLVAMSLIEDAIKLAFLQERKYAPYAKWLGTAFSRLTCAAELTPAFEQIRFARSWKEREAGLVDVVVQLGHAHHRLGMTEPVEATIREFHNRPFRVIFAERYSRALRDSVEDPDVRALPDDIGSTDQFLATTDALGNQSLRQALTAWFDEFVETGDLNTK